jgi:ATP-binding cassette subfamily F protein 3
MKKLDKLDRIEEAEMERPNMRINFRVDKTPGKVLAELKNVSKAFGENVIIKNGNAEIERGDKIALIGANGKGKSTLLRIIAGVEQFSEGERKWGHNVEESFYAQHQLEALNVNNAIIDEMKECGSQMNELELRGLLGCFLFSGDDADKKIKILSGGEKARVALAKVIVSKANFLMLDEPTNHLDMHSCDLLIESLNKYEGTMILVSHDRYFVSKTANKIWEIADHEIKEFKGGYEEWVQWKERMAKAEADNKKQQVGVKAEGVVQKVEDTKPKEVESKHPSPTFTPAVPQGPINKEAKKELQRLQKQFQNLEAEIAKLQVQKQTLEAELANPSTYSDKNQFLQTEADYKQINIRLNSINTEYEGLFEKIVAAESNAGG